MKEIKEEWKPTPLFDNYEASNFGRIRSKSKLVKHNYGGFALKCGKVLSQYVNSKGYACVGLMVGDKPKSQRVHRLVAMAFIKNPFNKQTVNHKDTNKLNNSVSNLEWATQKEQVVHAIKNKCRKSFAISDETKIKIGAKSCKIVEATDVFDSSFIQFKSLSDCASYFSSKQPTVSKAIKRQSLFQKKYKLSLLESGLAIDATTLK